MRAINWLIKCFKKTMQVFSKMDQTSPEVGVECYHSMPKSELRKTKDIRDLYKVEPHE